MRLLPNAGHDQEATVIQGGQPERYKSSNLSSSTLLHQSVLIETLDLIHRTGSLLSPRWRLRLANVHDALPLHTDYSLFPAFKVGLVTDKKGYEHGRIHLTYLDAAEAARVTGGQVLIGVGFGIFVTRQPRTCCVWVQIEEVAALSADEVVRC